jgi:hypothetical protein
MHRLPQNGTRSARLEGWGRAGRPHASRRIAAHTVPWKLNRLAGAAMLLSMRPRESDALAMTTNAFAVC